MAKTCYGLYKWGRAKRLCSAIVRPPATSLSYGAAATTCSLRRWAPLIQLRCRDIWVDTAGSNGTVNPGVPITWEDDGCVYNTLTTTATLRQIWISTNSGTIQASPESSRASALVSGALLIRCCSGTKAEEITWQGNSTEETLRPKKLPYSHELPTQVKKNDETRHASLLYCTVRVDCNPVSVDIPHTRSEITQVAGIPAA